MIPPHRTSTISLVLLLVLVISPTVLAWLSTSTTTSTNRRPFSQLQGTIDLPLDTFGDVNQEYVPDEDDLFDYYNSDAAQTIFPYLDQWRTRDDLNGKRCLVGLVYNHPSYANGEAIATSPLEETGVSSEDLVTTTSGSQYLLGAQVVVALEDWSVEKDRVQGTVTQTVRHLDLKKGQVITTSSVITTGSIEENSRIVTTSGSHYQLLTPTLTVQQPSFPVLEQWKRLEGGSLAGFVYQHPKLQDGELITTTPLIELDESNEGLVLVTTASGSHYQLGEPEPAKQYNTAVDYDEEEEEYEEEAVDDGIYYGEEEEDDEEEEEQEEEIPTFHIPSFPKQGINPLEHVFAAFSSKFNVNNHNRNDHKKSATDHPFRNVNEKVKHNDQKSYDYQRQYLDDEAVFMHQHDHDSMANVTAWGRG